MEDEAEFEVQLYIYDLSKGLASCLSESLFGKHLPGIWHTSLVIYGREYFFGSGGIESCEPGETILGEPDKVKNLGKTEVPYSLFLEYIFSLGESTYKPTAYNLFEHNCNNFTNDIAQFLCGKAVPDEILKLPSEVLNTPLGAAIQNILGAVNLRVEGSRGIGTGNLDSFAINCQAPKQNSSEKKLNPNLEVLKNNSSDDRLKASSESDTQSENSASKSSETHPEIERNMSENQAEIKDENEEKAPTKENIDKEIDELLSKPTPRTQRTREVPPVVFRDVNVTEVLASLEDLVKDILNPEEIQALGDIKDYLTTDCGSWALGNSHLALLGRLLGDRNLPPVIHTTTIKLLQNAAFKEDWILLLHQDRQDHHLMSYLYGIENLNIEEQEEIAKFLCNLCENFSSADWLMYISEWQEESRPCSNCRVSIRAAVHTVLSENPAVQALGAALLFNLSLKEQIFDDTATELGTAILQALHGDLPEEVAFHCLTALLRFMSVSYNDVPALVKMLGPDLSKFQGKSDRVNNLVDQINIKLTVSIAD